MVGYTALKTAHIISMLLLVGVGFGSAFYKWMADRTGQVAHMAVINRHVVLADWIFTTPAVIFQPASGFLMLHLVGAPWNQPWVLASLALYALAGACWLPVVWLQILMARLTDQALKDGQPLPEVYWRYARGWFWLGVPAFVAMMLVIAFMVFKHVPGLSL